MKKFIKAFAAVVISAMLSLCAFAESAGFMGESNVISAGTPYDKGYVEIRFSTGEAETAGVPLAYKEYLLSPTGNKIFKINEKTGATEMTAELDEKVSESSRGAIINDVLFQATRTKIFAVSLEDMSVKTSQSFGEIVTDVAAIDGLLYFGVKNDDGISFVCTDSGKNFDVVWKYECETTVTSAGLFGDFVVFGSGNKLVVHEKNNSGYSENEIGGNLKYVYAGKYAVFMTAENGMLYKLRLNDKGEAEALSELEIGGGISAPAEIDNKLFVSSEKGFYVVDALNMEVTKNYPELKNGCSPVITTGSGFRAYVVSPVESEGKWYLYSVLSNEDELSLNEIVKIIDFTDGKIAVSESGTMYFRDAKGQIYALAVRENDILTIVIKLLLFIAIIVFLVLILRAWIKKHSDKTPKFT